MARGNDLELFVDHLHLSDRGGAIVAGLAAGWLSAQHDTATKQRTRTSCVPG